MSCHHLVCMALLAAVGCEDMIVTDDMVIMCHAWLMLTGRVVCLADNLLTSVTYCHIDVIKGVSGNVDPVVL